jgi:hypothetical protein
MHTAVSSANTISIRPDGPAVVLARAAQPAMALRWQLPDPCAQRPPRFHLGADGLSMPALQVPTEDPSICVSGAVMWRHCKKNTLFRAYSPDRHYIRSRHLRFVTRAFRGDDHPTDSYRGGRRGQVGCCKHIDLA